MSAVLSEWAAAGGIAAVVFAVPAGAALLVDHHGPAAVRAARTATRHAALAAALWLTPVAVHAHHSYYVPGVRHG